MESRLVSGKSSVPQFVLGYSFELFLYKTPLNGL